MTWRASAVAQDSIPLFARGGLGGGFGTIDAVQGPEQPTTSGPGLQWDAALGVSVTRWLAVHASAFGSISPAARPATSCVDNCGPNRRTTIWAMNYGPGVTFVTPDGLGKTRLRPFFSSSAGLAIISGPLTRSETGVAAQVLLGVEYSVTPTVRVGLGLQGMFEGKRSLRLATENGFKAGHAGGIITISFDARPTPTRP